MRQARFFWGLLVVGCFAWSGCAYLSFGSSPQSLSSADFQCGRAEDDSCPITVQLPDEKVASAAGQLVCVKESNENASAGGSGKETCLQVPEVVTALSRDVSGNGDVVAQGEKSSYILRYERRLRQVFSVPTAPPDTDRIIVDKSANMLYWYRKGRFRARYRVATGREPQFTPEGNFTVAVKIADPPGEEALKPALGVRWLGLAVPLADDMRPKPNDERAPAGQKYGIHGTDEPESIGEHASGGCIRMRNADILQLYEQVSVGTPVQVRP